EPLATVAGTMFTDQSPPEGAMAWYRVVAVDGSTSGPVSAAVRALVVPSPLVVPPPAPLGLATGLATTLAPAPGSIALASSAPATPVRAGSTLDVAAGGPATSISAVRVEIQSDGTWRPLATLP